MTRQLSIACALVALVVLGCATDDQGRHPAGSRGEETGGSIFDQLDQARRASENRQPPPDLGEGASTLPEGWKETIDHAWILWRENDPGWPGARDEVVALGPRAHQILVDNLLRWYVRAQDRTAYAEQERAREELMLHSRQTIPILVAGLAGSHGDTVVRNLSADLLGAYRREAIGPIQEAWESAEPKGRRDLVRALRLTGIEESAPFLERIAGGSDTFEIRIEAIQGLGDLGLPRSLPVLAAALSDPDKSVRKFAAHYVSAPGLASPLVLQALVDCLQASAETAEFDTVRACVNSLRRLTGKSLGADVEGWRAIVAEARR